MIDRCLVGKVGLVAAFLLFISVISFSAEAAQKKGVAGTNVSKEKTVNKNSFNTPDFAFPETVEKRAEAEYLKALKGDDPIRALQASVQLTIARNLVSTANYKEGVKIFEELGETLPAPYNSLAYLLEARLYASIYNANAWRYNNRAIPLTPVPDDVEEWSRDIFANKIRDLVDKSSTGEAIAKEILLKEISPLVENSAEWVKIGMTVYDFMTLRSCDLLANFSDSESDHEIIPFGSGIARAARVENGNSMTTLTSLIDRNISWHDERGEIQQSAVMANFKLNNISWKDLKEFACQCVKKYIDTPYCAPFIMASQDYTDDVEFSDEEENANAEIESSLEKQNRIMKRQYELIDAYLKRFPDCSNAEALRNRLSVIGAEKITVNTSGRFYPGKRGSVRVQGENVFNFNLLIVKLPDSYLDKDIRLDLIKGIGNVVECVPVSFVGEKPAKGEKKIEIPELTSGVYVMVPSRTSGLSGMITGTAPKQQLSTFNVSRLASLRSSDSKTQEGDRFYVIDGMNQSPVSGAKVVFTSRDKSKRKIEKTTGEEGFVTIPAGSFDILVTKGKDRLSGNLWNWGVDVERERKFTRGKILTDLSVYHPGDTIGFMGVVYTEENRELHPEINREVKMILRDANWQGVDTLHLKSDKFGRVFGKVRIPLTGLLGSYSLRLSDFSSNNEYGSASVEVADYKTPTFYVASEGITSSYEIGDTIRIKGKAATYSGMPVGGSQVKYEVRYIPLWWLNSSENANYGGQTETSADGSFVIVLPTEGLRGSRFALGGYELKIAVTDAAGETQEAAPLWFSLGRAYSISESLPGKICADNGVKEYAVRVTDIIGKPVKKTVYYRITEKGEVDKTVASGEFESPIFEFDPKTLNSGEYKILFSLDKDFRQAENDQSVSANVVIYRDGDRTPPVETALWIPENRIVAKCGEDVVKVRVGSSYQDSWIFVQIADCDRVIDRKWMKLNDSIGEIEVPAPESNNRVSMRLTGMRNFGQNMETVTILPASQTENVKIETLSFRERISPGAAEHWRFRFKLKDNALSDIPVSAVMTNKALNDIMPFEWRFDPLSGISYGVKGNLQWGYYGGNGNWTVNLTKVRYGGIKNERYPNWNLYGLSLYGGTSMLRNLKIRGSSMKEEVHSTVYMSAVANEMKMADAVELADAEAESPMALQESVVSSASGMVSEGSALENGSGIAVEPELRQTEYPLAFFMPDLITDANGETVVDFTVPQFNGTWQFQIMGYTEEMKGAVAKMTTVASKPVMVSMNAPRFVRSGDMVSVAAMMYNNTAENTAVRGKIEIFDPVTGNVLYVKDSPSTDVDPAGASRIIIEFPIASEVNCIGIRAYAYGENHADGEQTVIPVYPSSTPVIESRPFYLGPGRQEFSLKLPSYAKGAKVTLQYSDNPIWDVVTALPDIAEAESSNILSLVYSLYGNAIGAGLVKDYPEIGNAIKTFADPANSGDSTLVSNLEKNQDLKNVVLNNTPWVRDASSETMRMQHLIRYSDASKSREIIEALLRDMAKLQNEDGGWSWCAGMKSSEFITARVLLHLAMLRDMGYLPGEGEMMAKRGVKYADACIVKDVNEFKGKEYPYISLLNYLYVRSNFKDVNKSAAFEQIFKRGLAAVRNSWKNLGIYEKATAATLLSREGYNMEARTILESLRQFATVSEEKGMWFDNLSSTFNGWNKLITTAQVLEAYSEIEPKNENVDKLRQWLLLTKQAENWGTDRETAEVIHAILSSGTRWTVASSPAQITLGGKPLSVDHIAALTGNLVVNLNSKSGEELRILRSSVGPAWGSIVSQYVAPILDVKSNGIPELSVEKNVYKVSTDGSETIAKSGIFKVGDKVRVTLTVRSDRDLEYVAIIDARSASLEPSEQLSGYSSSDGIWMYKEVRDDSTNLFIPFLPKGTHLISYECFIDRVGEYSLGIASAQSLYAPGIAAHSAGSEIIVKER